MLTILVQVAVIKITYVEWVLLSFMVMVGTIIIIKNDIVMVVIALSKVETASVIVMAIRILIVFTMSLIHNIDAKVIIIF